MTGSSHGVGSSTDFLTIKYSSAGVPLWTNRYNGPGNDDDRAAALVADGSNNVIVTGYSYGNGSSADYLTIKYSSTGVPLWTNRYNGPANSWDQATAVALDSDNNVIVTGVSSPGDYLTIKYSSEGVPLWTNRYNGAANGSDAAYAVSVDPAGNIHVAGTSYSGSSSNDFVTVKYAKIPPPAPPHIQDFRFTAGQLSFDLTGQPGQTALLQASTNLTDWLPIATNVLGSNPVVFTDPQSSQFPQRFYRLFKP